MKPAGRRAASQSCSGRNSAEAQRARRGFLLCGAPLTCEELSGLPILVISSSFLFVRRSVHYECHLDCCGHLSPGPPSITTTVHKIEWLVSENCIGERSGAKLSYKLAYSCEGIPKSPFIPTVVVILAVSQLWNRKGKGGEVWIGRPGF